MTKVDVSRITETSEVVPTTKKHFPEKLVSGMDSIAQA